MSVGSKGGALGRHLAVGAAAGIALLAPAGPATPAAPISAKRAEATQILAEVRTLDDQLEQSVEAYNLARIKLASNARALTTNGHRLSVARRNLTSARRRIAARLVYLYTTDESASPLDVILGARSLGDLLDRLDAARRIADQDALVLGQVRVFKAQVTQQRRRLGRERNEEKQLAAELASHRATILQLDSASGAGSSPRSRTRSRGSRPKSAHGKRSSDGKWRRVSPPRVRHGRRSWRRSPSSESLR